MTGTMLAPEARMLTHTQPRTIFAHPWRIAALVAVVANITFNYVNGRSGAAGNSVADISARYPTFFTPAGYAFAIWGVIYASTLAYAVAALTPSQLGVRFHDRIAPWLVVLSALASLWVALFSAEQLGPSVLIIGAMLTASVVIYSTVSQHLESERLSRWWRAPFALWLGWLSVATIANLSIALSAAGWSGWPLSGPIWSAILLCLAGLLAFAISVLYLDPVVAFVVSWAAAAIAVAHWQDSSLVAIVATLVSIKTLLAGARLLLFSTFPPPAGHASAPRRVVLPRNWLNGITEPRENSAMTLK